MVISRKCILVLIGILLATGLIFGNKAIAQDLSEGPFDRLVIRNATLIDGTGAPPTWPVDIVIEDNRITEVVTAGNDFGDIDEEDRPEGGDHEIDASGMYVMPGFIDAHVHIRREERSGASATYNHYLNLGHGITTVLDAGSGNGIEWTVNERERSANNNIVAPRIYAYVRPGMTPGDEDRMTIANADDAIGWVQQVSEAGVDGLKLGAHRPDIMEALIDEAHKESLLTTAHLGQDGVTRMNLLDAARLGLDHQQHWYGLAESMLEDGSIPDWPTDKYNQNNEQDRFAQAGRFFDQAVEVDSPKWNKVMNELLELDFTIVPTSSVYEFTRDLQRRRNLEWHEEFSTAGMLEYWEPNPDNHGSLYFDWTTEYEAWWYQFFHKWQQFLKEYNDRGGRIVAGSDAGSAYSLMGFGYIRELEMLQMAGLHPLEVVRSATMYGAESIGESENLGTIEEGKLADLVIVDENPLENFKVLYGTGHQIYDHESESTERIGKVNYTIKDGIVYDAERLLDEVKEIVAKTKE